MELPYREKVEKLQMMFIEGGKQHDIDIETNDNCRKVLYPSVSRSLSVT